MATFNESNLAINSSVSLPFKVYIGYDSHEDIAFEVATFSLRRNSSIPVEVIALKQKELRDRGVYWRTKDPKQTTEFTYLRFLIPYLNNYQGWAMFVDDDFLFTGDIAELVAQCDDKYAVMCVQHEYNPGVSVKLAGVSQEPYPRKNWSSMVLYNCGHPANKILDLEVANSQTGAYLHRFTWLSDDLIGNIDKRWNYLISWYPQITGTGLKGAIHYTEGGPWYPDYRDTDFSKEWFEELALYEATLPTKRKLCPYELFSQNGIKPLTGYENSNETWTWAQDQPIQ
eukprot:TRINITY_DN46_c0_g2_i3.p1 TRINITY_DN46_c0_g2~~TRINITY_DN46_c0_g2_i3.p1  ORF type:complete len:285 (-),score=132.12 TRINITY_DN46_c0_g2_i3:131-985(-)